MRLTLLAVVSLAVGSFWSFGCSSGDDGPGAPGEGGDSVLPPTSTTPPTSPVCKGTEKGCRCAREGERVACGTVTETRPDGRTVCGPGGAVCEGGKWSACTIDAYAPGH